MVGIFGTTAADVTHIVLHAPYVVSFAGYAAVLAILFVAWRMREGTVDVHQVTTLLRECFYWVAVVLTLAMGTALGDLTAISLKLGYFPSAVLFAGLILVPAGSPIPVLERGRLLLGGLHAHPSPGGLAGGLARQTGG